MADGLQRRAIDIDAEKGNARKVTLVPVRIDFDDSRVGLHFQGQKKFGGQNS